MIGVVGPGARIADAIERAGGAARSGNAGDVRAVDPDAIVAVGDGAVIDLVRAGVDVPFLPVETDFGRDRDTRDDAIGAIDALIAGEYETRREPTFAVRAGDTRLPPAAFDVTVATAEPARISEYRIETDRVIDDVRADGVSIATPAGSRGFGNAAGGPVVRAGADLASVVPLGDFRLDRDRWVVDLSTPLSVSIEREEVAVALSIDGREPRSVAIDDTVEIRAGDSIETIRLPG